MAFDRLHPAVQHHVVNTLGWRTLRPLQRDAIGPLLDGKHTLLLAPTASGKTEAAVLPLMSRMLTENWTGLTVIYLCPIKALLNNLHSRLSTLMQLVGRTVGIWHGDVSAGDRKRILRNPPDCLLTTPESLELMLVSSTTDERALFAHLRAVIVDEIHAFAGDDRGWHLLCLLSRLAKLAASPVQRVGLSATVGNPDQLLEWLAGKSPGERVVVNPVTVGASPPELKLDFVGSLENAAFVVSQLYRGEKRLVFCDSRSRAEQMAARLRGLGIATFVSHSSLSVDERRQAESAFVTGTDCVIVATSTLELGIDVGDLDRVIQLDAPTTVKSFLQRLGRTGRRAGVLRNCLFLATSPLALMQAAGLIELWRSGYVEPTLPPPKPFHVLAQQLMALALQEQGIGRHEWLSWLSQAGALAETQSELADSIASSLVAKDILFDDQGLLWFGQRGERELSYRAFSELLSVFTTEPLLRAMHGSQDIGLLHPLSLSQSSAGPRVVLLSGRSWYIQQIDWRRGVVTVAPAAELGRSLWRGGSAVLSQPMCSSIRSVLMGSSTPTEWSRRAAEQMRSIRTEHDFLQSTSLQVGDDGEAIWWTFAGLRANSQLACALEEASGLVCTPSNLSVGIEGIPKQCDIDAVLDLPAPLPLPRATIDQYLKSVKFIEYLPDALQAELVMSRLKDDDAIRMLRDSGRERSAKA